VCVSVYKLCLAFIICIQAVFVLLRKSLHGKTNKYTYTHFVKQFQETGHAPGLIVCWPSNEVMVTKSLHVLNKVTHQKSIISSKSSWNSSHNYIEYS